MTECIRHLQWALEKTPQDPIWHGEGNVWTHTLQVCESLYSLPEYREAEERTRKILALAAAFHDVGKLSTTKMEDGRWVSHGHSKASARMARQYLWQDLGFCGTREAQQFREAVCTLVRYHGLPVHAIDADDGKRRLMRFAANGALVPELTVKHLCTLAKADILGRVCPDQQELLEKVELAAELAREADCYTHPYGFSTGHTLCRFLSGGGTLPPECPIYDDTWGEVLLLSGLPGTGKDTWIRENCPDLPMVSLDDIRRALCISPTDNQSKVLEAAREQAKGYLRRREPFVWNATNLTPMVRSKQIDLFARYGASVRLVYLETRWEEQLRRNRSRADAVPEQAVCKMLDTLTPPERFEAQNVQWICV